MKNWAAYTKLEPLLDDIRTRFLQAEKEGTACSLNVSNATGVYTLLPDEPSREEVSKLAENLRSGGSSS
jgi:hypothetical protein